MTFATTPEETTEITFSLEPLGPQSNRQALAYIPLTREENRRVPSTRPAWETQQNSVSKAESKREGSGDD